MKILKHINQSAKYSIAGIIDTFKEETMMKFHTLMGIFIIILALIFVPSNAIIFLLFYMYIVVLAMELMNTGVENNVDLASKKKEELGRRSKDSAAGAVFLVNITFYLTSIFVLVKYIFIG